jgi:hypothetical protein
MEPNTAYLSNLHRIVNFYLFTSCSFVSALATALALQQGCQMVYFQTKSHSFGTFWKAFEWIYYISLMTIWYTFLTCRFILWQFGIFCGHLFTLSPFWYFASSKIWQPWLKPKQVDCKSLVSTSVIFYAQCPA